MTNVAFSALRWLRQAPMNIIYVKSWRVYIPRRLRRSPARRTSVIRMVSLAFDTPSLGARFFIIKPSETLSEIGIKNPEKAVARLNQSISEIENLFTHRL